MSSLLGVWKPQEKVFTTVLGKREVKVLVIRENVLEHDKNRNASRVRTTDGEIVWVKGIVL
ncbi:hypothetical protein C5B42_03155 [Candidatus Cerribacteria bacterium 'Amazon FNV 2010 28 9']|uniref:Uncharacterized protein n=1 Tax=Candidatus Cerribacteria bacterium 'Amazon FNV 2010 28 9' TaxID=2081795 RepID=A0A317JTV6_9BACT|nr:MAG: hypothetical protein C5B42_03155 [Candidatus Cerribacteria bacterium 'Amazon FNV 2010 28 9']